MAGATRSAHIVLAHDWLVGMRGGERVLDRLAHLFGPTTIYTLVRDGSPMSDAISACRVVTSPLQQMPGASGRLRRWYLPLMPWAVGQLRVEPCDLVISTSSAVMKSIQPPRRADGSRVPHMCYCHSPARYVWEQTGDYAQGRGGRLRTLGLRAVKRRFQEWDRRTADRVDVFLANSAHTAARVKRCYGREAIVVHPPARTEYFTPDPAAEREDWMLAVTALEPYKRTELLIESANRAGFKLKVAGSGSQASRLAKLAGPTVDMLGYVDDQRLRELYRRARALLFPQMEDFGLVPVEAQACGCPVVALAAGGALESVTLRTGVFFERPTVGALLGAIEAMQAAPLDPAACRANALRFSEEQFDSRMMAQVERLLAGERPREVAGRTSVAVGS